MNNDYYDERINPCEGCLDYDLLQNKCTTNGGCAGAYWVPEVYYDDKVKTKWYKWRCSICGYVRTAGWINTKEGHKPITNYCENCGERIIRSADDDLEK